MIISRTPFRISFFGGGTDYPDWYNDNGGAVLSTSIDKYCYITCRYLPPFFDYKYRIVYSQREEKHVISEIDHPSVRECLSFINFDKGIEIHHDADLPAKTGLGSSSSFTVGLLNALYALKGKMVSKNQLAMDAIYVEQEKIKENVGSQDQTVAAYGGLNLITFRTDKNVIVQPVTLPKERTESLNDHLMLFFTGFSRNASDIAKEQIQNISGKRCELKKMHEMVEEAMKILNSNTPIKEFGKLLHESWKLKRGLSTKITTLKIDNFYEEAMKAGAIGGKLLGAGGGGFILFLVEPEKQVEVKRRLSPLLFVPFSFENTGSQIIYYDPEHNNHDLY